MAEPDLTYVYCVADASKLGAMKELPEGLPNASKPRFLPLSEDSDFMLIAASVKVSDYAAEQIDARLKDLEWVSNCAIGHERMVELFAQKTTVIPMKMFTLFSSDERAIKDVAKKKKIIERTMKKLDGREEWGVRIFFDELAALAKATPKTEGPPSSGTSFLERKKGERDVKKHVMTHAAQEANDVFESLALTCDDARRRSAPATTTGPRVVLDAAFLVPKKQHKKFKTALEEHADRLGALGYDVKLTGPWPPYNFVGEGA